MRKAADSTRKELKPIFECENYSFQEFKLRSAPDVFLYSVAVSL